MGRKGNSRDVTHFPLEAWASPTFPTCETLELSSFLVVRYRRGWMCAEAIGALVHPALQIAIAD